MRKYKRDFEFIKSKNEGINLKYVNDSILTFYQTLSFSEFSLQYCALHTSLKVILKHQQ